MGLLETWGDYSTYIDADGYYRVIWQFDDGSICMHKFSEYKTDEEVNKLLADQDDWGGAVKLQTVLDDDETLIKEMVVFIRTNPALGLTVWTDYLSTKKWYEQVTIRVFIYKIALLLAENYGVELDDYTETEVLVKVRNWIVNAPIRTLKRVVFGYNITM